MDPIQLLDGRSPINEIDGSYIVLATSYSNETSHNNHGNNSTSFNSYPLEVAITVAKATVMLMIVGATLLGNALVILGVYRTEKLRSSIANVFIVSLAAADLMVALLVMPFSAVQVSALQVQVSVSLQMSECCTGECVRCTYNGDSFTTFIGDFYRSA